MSGIIDACLYNLVDVPRAQNVFDRLRQSAGASVLGSGLYNSLLNAYLGMSLKDAGKKNYWVEEAWKLYNILESGEDDVLPSVRTYSIVLALWHT
jgi:DNA-directed RNA polymerase